MEELDLRSRRALHPFLMILRQEALAAHRILQILNLTILALSLGKCLIEDSTEPMTSSVGTH